MPSSVGSRWCALLFEAVPELRVRPELETWSAIEYAAQSRDITALHVFGVEQALTEDEPVFPAIEADTLIQTSAATYHDEDPDAVVVELDREARRLGERATVRGQLESDHDRRGTEHGSQVARTRAPRFAASSRRRQPRLEGPSVIASQPYRSALISYVCLDSLLSDRRARRRVHEPVPCELRTAVKPEPGVVRRRHRTSQHALGCLARALARRSVPLGEVERGSPFVDVFCEQPRDRATFPYQAYAPRRCGSRNTPRPRARVVCAVPGRFQSRLRIRDAVRTSCISKNATMSVEATTQIVFFIGGANRARLSTPGVAASTERWDARSATPRPTTTPLRPRSNLRDPAC